MGKLKQKAYSAMGKLMGLPRTRKFDGQTYYISKTGMTKNAAAKYAKEARDAGQKARAIKTTLAKWCVYIN